MKAKMDLHQEKINAWIKKDLAKKMTACQKATETCP
jgi:hypothetical protein